MITKKTLRYLFLAAAASLTATACTDSLDEFPQDKLSPETYFSSETELQLYTNQFYSLMPTPSESSMMWYQEQGEHIVTPTLQRCILGNRIIPTDASDVGWTWTTLRKINYYLQNSHRCSYNPQNEMQRIFKTI
jgi:hypothetical protein